MIKSRNLVKNCIIKIIVAVFVVLGSVLLTSIPVSANENGNLEYHISHSYDDMMSFIEGDVYFYSREAITKEENGGEWDLPINELWTLKINEPGWFMVFEYHSMQQIWDNWVVYPYIYTNKAMTKAIDRQLPNSLQESYSGAYFKNRDCYMFYLSQGEYYLNMFSDKIDCDAGVILYAVFLPFDDLCKVREIIYNEEYTEAVVVFDYLSDKWQNARFASRKNVAQDALDGEAYWEIFYRNGYEGLSGAYKDYREFDDVLHEGYTATKNGDYSLYFDINQGEFKGLSVMVNFTIDKIGKEATKIEAKSTKINKKKATVKVGEEINLKVTLKPKNVTDNTITWKSSNKKVATVDKNGKVTAKKKGTCTITATTSNGKKAKCKITVKK